MEQNKAAALFDDWEAALIWSCLQGHMGTLRTDDAENPQSAVISIGDFSFFAGAPNATLFRTIRGFQLLVPQNELWEAEIEHFYGNRAHSMLRYAIKKEPEVFDYERLSALISALDDRYTLRLFDQTAFTLARAERWSQDLCSQFQSFADYQNRAIGVAIFEGDELVAGASPYAIYDDGIEIEIDTKPTHRRRGLATVCGAKLIMECHKRAVYPSWDAHDLRSVALAEKLGYHMAHPYTTYVLMGD